MIVGDVMARDVHMASPTETIREAASKMRDLNIGVLPVCLRDGRVVGVITDRDIAVRAAACASDCSTTLVRYIMTKGAVACFEHVPLEEAVSLMRDEKVRQVVVVDIKDRLVGMLSLGHVARFADEMLAAKTLKWISEYTDSADCAIQSEQL